MKIYLRPPSKVRKRQRGLKPFAGGAQAGADARRAQRFRLHMAVRYRASGEATWHWGMTKNISCSGILFHGEDWAEPCTPIELCLALPKGETGGGAAEVLCRGAVTRSEWGGDEVVAPFIASRISHYRFVRL